MLIDKITNDEVQMFNYYRQTYVENANFIDNASSYDFILRIWEYNKEQFLSQIFKDKLILKKHITVTAPPYVLIRQMDEFIYKNKKATNFYNHLMEELRKHEEIDKGFLSCLSYSMSSPTALTDNRFISAPFYSNIPRYVINKDGKQYTFTIGQKLMKVIRKLSLIYNIKGYEDYLIEHSQILNTASLEGDLCLSIHPLDYLTMSDNKNGWNSCMSWRREGEYRQGTVEMMNSPYIIVGYIDSKDPMTIDGYEWNNKKYRSLYYCGPDIITNIKGYPFISKEVDLTVIKWLRNLVESSTDIKYDNKIIDFCSNDNDYWIDFETNFMYNDVLNWKNDNYTHIAYISDPNQKEYFNNYSGEAECMICGSATEIISAETLACPYCSYEYSCDNCGRGIDGNEMIEVDDMKLCLDCYRDLVREDYFTGEEHLLENMAEIEFIDKRIFYLYGYNDLSEFFIEGTYCTEPGCYYAYEVDELTLTGLELFGIERD